VERIDEDLDLHAKKKKLLRLADAQFLAGQTPDLPKLQLRLRELKIDDIQLGVLPTVVSPAAIWAPVEPGLESEALLANCALS
jgi:hypothetical protein